MFYAVKHYRDVRFCNDYSTLFRFESKSERDDFVYESNFKEAAECCHYKTEAVTRDDARRHFPNAFRMVGDFHDVTDQRDWLEGATTTSAYWCFTNINYHRTHGPHLARDGDMGQR